MVLEHFIIAILQCTEMSAIQAPSMRWECLLSIRTMTLRSISSMEKNNIGKKKFSHFHRATFMWLNNSFQFISPKLSLSTKNSWDLCEKSFTPQLKGCFTSFFTAVSVQKFSCQKEKISIFLQNFNF